MKEIFAILFSVVLAASSTFEATAQFTVDRQYPTLMNETVRRATGGNRSALSGVRSDSTRFRIGARIPREIEEQRKVSPTDLAAYKDFLGKPDTGIFKLLARTKCNVRENAEAYKMCVEKQATIRFFATSYSLRENRHVSEQLGDLVLWEDQLIADGKGLQTIMVQLGDVPLDSISLASGDVEYLAQFPLATTVTEAQKQADELAKGVTFGHHQYWSSVWARPETPYAIRSIAYSLKHQSINAGPNGDVIAAFRIIRRDPEGSVTIIWKELQRRKAPTF